METLNAMERIGTDNKDRPVEEIMIEAAQIFTDPYAEVDEQVKLSKYRNYYTGNLERITKI